MVDCPTAENVARDMILACFRDWTVTIQEPKLHIESLEATPDGALALEADVVGYLDGKQTAVMVKGRITPLAGQAWQGTCLLEGLGRPGLIQEFDCQYQDQAVTVRPVARQVRTAALTAMMYEALEKLGDRTEVAGSLALLHYEPSPAGIAAYLDGLFGPKFELTPGVPAEILPGTLYEAHRPALSDGRSEVRLPMLPPTIQLFLLQWQSEQSPRH